MNNDVEKIEFEMSSADIRRMASAAGYGFTVGTAKGLAAIYICVCLTKSVLKYVDLKCRIKEKDKVKEKPEEQKEEETTEK